MERAAMSEKAEQAPSKAIALYDAIGRAIANLHAALAEVDAAWVLITAERPEPSVEAFAALDAAEQILGVAREDLARARTALTAYTGERREQ
jgi:predicted trehalose synthase